jgi:hypothetical protein
MPNLKKVPAGELTTNREIENTFRILETVSRQIKDYKLGYLQAHAVWAGLARQKR